MDGGTDARRITIHAPEDFAAMRTAGRLAAETLDMIVPHVRRAAMMHEVPCITTLTGAAAAVSAIRALRQQGVGVRALQDYYAGIAAGSV